MSLDGGTVAPHELLVGAPLSRGQDVPHLVENEEVLAVSVEMRQFLDASVHRKASSQVKLKELIDAIINEGDFGFEFEGETRTASETFRLRRGNCLSFSNMFVALARYVGLEARYQEVDIPPDWAFQNDFFLLNRHVNVSVDLGPSGQHVVDLNIDDFRTSYDTRTISDTRAWRTTTTTWGSSTCRRAMWQQRLATFAGLWQRTTGVSRRPGRTWALCICGPTIPSTPRRRICRL